MVGSYSVQGYFVSMQPVSVRREYNIIEARADFPIAILISPTLHGRGIATLTRGFAPCGDRRVTLPPNASIPSFLFPREQVEDLCSTI